MAVPARQVFSVERHESLAREAEAALAKLNVQNVSVVVGDGSTGWLEFAPFDAVLVSAAAPSVPHSLTEQLSEGGRMVIPVGPPQEQVLQLVRKHEGRVIAEKLEGCRFVPLVGAEGYRLQED